MGASDHVVSQARALLRSLSASVRESGRCRGREQRGPRRRYAEASDRPAAERRVQLQLLQLRGLHRQLTAALQEARDREAQARQASDASFADAEDARFMDQRLRDLAAACDEYEMPTLEKLQKQIVTARRRGEPGAGPGDLLVRRWRSSSGCGRRARAARTSSSSA